MLTIAILDVKKNVLIIVHIRAVKIVADIARERVKAHVIVHVKIQVVKGKEKWRKKIFIHVESFLKKRQKQFYR